MFSPLPRTAKKLDWLEIFERIIPLFFFFFLNHSSSRWTNYNICRHPPRLFRLVYSPILFFIIDQTMTPPEAGKWKATLSSFVFPRLFVQRWNREFIGPEVDHRVSLKLPFSARSCLVGRGGRGQPARKIFASLVDPFVQSHPPVLSP